MADSPPDHAHADHAHRVPDELMQQLHAATAELHERKAALEGAMSASEYSHQRHLHAAREQYEQAERALEQINQKVRQAMESGESTT